MVARLRQAQPERVGVCVRFICISDHPEPVEGQAQCERDSVCVFLKSKSVDTQRVPCPELVEGSGRTGRGDSVGGRDSEAGRGKVGTGCEFVGYGYCTKLAANDPSSKFHPSASTNNISLKGRATNTGLSIIMPRLMSTLATIMSMTRKGMKIKKPI